MLSTTISSKEGSMETSLSEDRSSDAGLQGDAEAVLTACKCCREPKFGFTYTISGIKGASTQWRCVGDAHAKLSA